MFVYDADTTVDAQTWRSLDESRALVLVADYHRRCKPHPKAGNQRLHNLIHVVVENQVAMGDQTPAAAKLEELIAAGLSRHDAVHAIGSVFGETLYGIVDGGERKPFDSDGRYNERLKALTAQSWLDGFADVEPFADPGSDEADDDLSPRSYRRPRSPEELLDPGLEPHEARDPETVVQALDLPSPL